MLLFVAYTHRTFCAIVLMLSFLVIPPVEAEKLQKSMEGLAVAVNVTKEADALAASLEKITGQESDDEIMDLTGEPAAAKADPAPKKTAPPVHHATASPKINAVVPAHAPHASARPLPHKRKDSKDSGPAPKVAHRSFVHKYDQYDDPMTGRLRAEFFPLSDYLQNWFERNPRQLSGYLRSDPGKVAFQQLFHGRSIYSGVAHKHYANVTIDAANPRSARSPLDSRMALKEHLGREYKCFLEPDLPLIKCDEDAWPIETLYIFNVLMPDALQKGGQE
ncbi:hypothetical protein AAVH_24588 [Aphelenchoides avenae]|nr:hypothetical protein AAVH_24588 [Aphelenchus avenae]